MRQLLLAPALALVLAGCVADRTISPDASDSPGLARLSPDAPAVAAEGQGVAHSLTGRGDVHPAPGFAFGTTLAVHQDAGGELRGTVVTHIRDMSIYGVSETGVFVAEPVCMRVVGNVAYLSMRTIRSEVPAVSRVGDLGVLWVVDNGTSGDLHYGGPAAFFDPSNLICSETPPPMPATPITSGNLTVR